MINKYETFLSSKSKKQMDFRKRDRDGMLRWSWSKVFLWNADWKMICLSNNFANSSVFSILHFFYYLLKKANFGKYANHENPKNHWITCLMPASPVINRITLTKHITTVKSKFTSPNNSSYSCSRSLAWLCIFDKYVNY